MGTPLKNSGIAFIGGGNMATSLISGLIADGCAPHNIWVADPDAAKLAELVARFSVNTTHSNQQAVAQTQVIVLAVKPQAMPAVVQELGVTQHPGSPLIISIAAGVRVNDINAWLGGKTAIVRAMPNTPALVQSGATALYANALVSADQHNLAESILRAVGMVLWLDDEAQMDAVTALSGSGPAYFFLVMEVLENAAVRLGLARNDARLLTLQTAFGAAKMALESAEHSATLRARVTSPGGTTEQAVKVLQEGGIQDLFDAALRAAHARSNELATLMGNA
jgi:pyrroline-5-carboxylate reductase